MTRRREDWVLRRFAVALAILAAAAIVQPWGCG
jgi:hypothetical protein